MDLGACAYSLQDVPCASAAHAARDRHTFTDSAQAIASGPKMLFVCRDAAVSHAGAMSRRSIIACNRAELARKFAQKDCVICNSKTASFAVPWCNATTGGTACVHTMQTKTA
jgi:hypothetical protein